MKSRITKSMLGAVLGLSIFGMLSSEAQAQSKRSPTKLATVADEQKRTGITTYYYGYKSNAVGKLNAEKSRGKNARMYYDNSRR